MEACSRPLRYQTKRKFKEGLFFFESDKSTSILSTRLILEDDAQVFEGNTVTLKWEDDFLRAKIIKLSGMVLVYILNKKLCT